MTSDTPTVTLDLLIEVLKEVIDERAPRDRREAEAVNWEGGTSLEEVGFSSYDFVELVFKIEDRFGIEIDYNANNNINDVKTIGALRDEIAKLVAQKHAA